MIKIKFAHEKETPNTQRFHEIVPDGEKAKMGTIWLGKEWAGNATELTLTIETA